MTLLGKRLVKLAEIFIARIFPGLISVCALLVLSEKLPTAEYGLFSTMLATAGLVANIFFGPVSMMILPYYAVYQEKNEGKLFEKKIWGFYGLMLAVLATAGGLLSLVWVSAFPALLVVAALGGVACLMPLVQARIQFWRYGLVSSVQSLIFFIMVFLWVDENYKYLEVIYFYCISCFFGILVLYISNGFPGAKFPDKEFFSTAITSGVPLTVSTLSESVLFLGFRYLILLLGRPELLGAFSLMLDLAQRAVGVVVSITSFAILPHAYRKDAQGDRANFLKTLFKGSLLSLLLALFMVFGVVVVSYAELVDSLSASNFSIAYFGIICAGLVFNRIRKMLLDPVIIKDKLSFSIPVGYVLSGSMALLAGYFALKINIDSMFYFSYMIGYWLAALFTLIMIGGLSRFRVR